MSRELNSAEMIEVSESVDIVTELVNKTDDLRSKFKGIYLNYDLGIHRYNFVNEVYFFAPIPSDARDAEIGSIITLELPITKSYTVMTPGVPDPDQDTLIKITVQHGCEYTRDGKTVQASQYKVCFNSSGQTGR